MNKISNLSNAEYHRGEELSEYISSSQLKNILISPEYYQYKKKNPMSQTKAMALGSAVHVGILEPEKADTDVILEPEINKRTDAGKKEYESFLNTIEADQVVLDTKQHRIYESIMAKYYKIPELKELFTGGEAEVSITDKIGSIGLKVRPDYLKDDLIIDLKTTSKPISEFSKACVNFGYHFSAAMYCFIAGVNNFKFAVIETNPPYSMAILTPDTDFMDKGRKQFFTALDMLGECQQYNIFPGIEVEQKLSLPIWYKG